MLVARFISLALSMVHHDGAFRLVAATLEYPFNPKNRYRRPSRCTWGLAGEEGPVDLREAAAAAEALTAVRQLELVQKLVLIRPQRLVNGPRDPCLCTIQTKGDRKSLVVVSIANQTH